MENTPNIKDQIDLNLYQYLEKYKGFYNNQIESLDNPNKNQIRQRFIFSVFTVHRQFVTSKKAFKIFKNRIPKNITLKELRKSKVGLYTQARLALKNWDKVLNAIETIEDKDKLREYLLKNIKGISLAKVTFFLSLIYPKSNFICLDTWICKYYGIDQSKLNYKQYLEIESKNSQLANRIGYFPFALQWAIWEFVQKKGKIDHSFLWI